jgi:hypothetical protein
MCFSRLAGRLLRKNPGEVPISQALSFGAARGHEQKAPSRNPGSPGSAFNMSHKPYDLAAVAETAHSPVPRVYP